MIAEPEAALSAYRDLRVRVTELLADVSDDEAATTAVPACPGWTVTDVASHLCGVTVDILDGNLDGVATDAWTASQVERLAPGGLASVLRRWSEAGPAVESLAAAFPPQAAVQMVFDASTHEQDLRGALRRPGSRDADSVLVGLGFMEANLDRFVRERDLPALGVRSPHWSAVMGEGDAVVEVEASTFELFRSFGGRRSEAQVRALPWTGDPGAYLALFDSAPVKLRTDDLIE